MAKKLNQACVLAINGGSSSIKFALYQVGEALEQRLYQVKKWIGSCAAALGGLETVVFVGGIGENTPLVRTRICEGLNFLGIELHESRNAETAGVIPTDASRVTVRVIRRDEERMIAKMVCRAVGLPGG